MTVTRALACKKLKKRRQVHVVFCCRHFYYVRIKSHCRHRSTELLTTQTDQSKRYVLIDYVLKQLYGIYNVNVRSRWIALIQDGGKNRKSVFFSLFANSSTHDGLLYRWSHDLNRYSQGWGMPWLHQEGR